jgi:predicted RNase H-like nuclease (RuvC/YqgF family)
MTSAERYELRADLKAEIEEIGADIVGYREDLRRAKEQIAEAKAKRAKLVARRNELRTTKTERRETSLLDRELATTDEHLERFERYYAAEVRSYSYGGSGPAPEIHIKHLEAIRAELARREQEATTQKPATP